MVRQKEYKDLKVLRVSDLPPAVIVGDPIRKDGDAKGKMKDPW